MDTESVTVNGNGTYTTPTGFTLPATGTVTGTYQWDASYGGDANNNPVSDNNAANEQVTVSGQPDGHHLANPAAVTLGIGTVTLTDTATLAALSARSASSLSRCSSTAVPRRWTPKRWPSTAMAPTPHRQASPSRASGGDGHLSVGRYL